MDEELPEIRIYVLLAAAKSYGGVYGVGVTERSAEDACVAAGTTRALARKGKMLRLPLGVTHFAVDCFGICHWRVKGEGITPAETLVWSKKDTAWCPAPKATS